MAVAVKRYSTAATIALIFILIAPSELLYKTERIYYVFCFGILLLYSLKEHLEIKLDYRCSIFLYGIYMLISYFWSPNHGATSLVLVKLVTIGFLFLQSQNVYSEEEYKTIENGFILQFFIIFIISLRFRYIGWDGRIWIGNGGVYTDGNSLSAWLIVPSCCLFNKIVSGTTKGLAKIISFALLVALISLTYLTGSRAGIISVAIALILCIAYSIRSNLKYNIGKSLLLVILGIALIFLAVYLLPDSVVSRFEYSNTAELGGRTEVWKQLFADLWEHPFALIFGFGESATIARLGVVAHCFYFEILYNQGFLGLILILYYMINLFKNSLKNSPYDSIALIGLAIVSASLSEFASRPVMMTFFRSSMEVDYSESENELEAKKDNE